MFLKPVREDQKVRFSSKGWISAWILLAMSVLLAAGLFSGGVSLGDETHHYRFAKSSYWLNQRAAFDVIFSSGNPPGFYYATDPLWPLMLAAVWKCVGHVSFAATQIYQSLYYALLLICTYLSAKKIYGEHEALWSLFLVATVPMLVSFSVLFYGDVPATAFAMLGFLLLLEKKYFWFSIVLALQFLMKRNMLFFMPAFLGILLHDQGIRKAKTWGFAAFSLTPFMGLAFWDSLWRAEHFPVGFSMLFQIVTRIKFLSPLKRILFSSEIARIPLSPTLEPSRGLFLMQFSNSNIFSLKDNVVYFGIPFIVAVLIYLLGRKEKKDIRLWVPVIFFLAINFALRITPDIRYVLPVTPFLAILAATGINRVCKNKLAMAIVLLIGFGQLTATAGYTAVQRRISPEIQEGFAYIRKNFPKEAVSIYPEVNFLEYTERPMVWGNLYLAHFLGGNAEERTQAILNSRADYIVIKKSRIYDDLGMPIKHYGGYPQSLINWLPLSGMLEKVFENSSMAIWKIKYPPV